MKNSRSRLGWVASSILLLTSGCATSASGLKPRDVDAEDGAFFGHFEVLNEGENVTKHCYVKFTDSHDDRKKYVSLDETGWVFTTVKPGTTYLSMVLCTIGGFVKANAHYDTRLLKFEVSAKGTLGYFGHVHIDLNFNTSGIAAATLLAGSIGNAIVSSYANGKGEALVENRFEAAQAEYKKRYGLDAPALKPVLSLLLPDQLGKRLPASN